MIDEQRLRARLAALDAAVRMLTAGGRSLVNNDQMITDTADTFETWLMRPTPSGEPTEALACDANVGYVRCDTAWRKPDGQMHRCRWTPAHTDSMGHVCTCGDELRR